MSNQQSNDKFVDGHPAGNIYWPERAVDRALEEIQRRIDTPRAGINHGIPGWVGTGEGKLAPLRANQLWLVIGYLSNGKSSIMNYIMSQHAFALRSYRLEDPKYNHIIIYISFEFTVEEQISVDFSRRLNIPAHKIFNPGLSQQEIKDIWTIGAQDRRSLPIWLIASSMKDDLERQRFTMTDIIHMCKRIEEAGFVIDLLFLDYLTRVNIENVEDMRRGYIGVVNRCKDIAKRFPVVLACQGKQEVKQHKDGFYQPAINEVAETQDAAQACDVALSLWMPFKDHKETISLYGTNYAVNDKTLVMSVLKQKQGSAPLDNVFQMGYLGTSLEIQEPLVSLKTKDDNEYYAGKRKK